jgi:dynein heavy chain 2, cytosolic
LNLWEGPENVSTFLRSLVRKCEAIKGYRDKLSSGKFFNEPLQLSEFLNPITFLNAQRQQTSRQSSSPLTVVMVSMDSLKLVSNWTASDLEGCPITVTAQGMLIQGCKYDGASLSEADQNDPIFSMVPNFVLGWVKETSINLKSKLEVPVYSSPSREHKVTSLLVPCTDFAVWILAGVAFFLSSE